MEQAKGPLFTLEEGLLDALVPFFNWVYEQGWDMMFRAYTHAFTICEVLGGKRTLDLFGPPLPDLWGMAAAYAALRDLACAYGFVEAGACCEEYRERVEMHIRNVYQKLGIER